jgi:hypothetical protein
MEISKTYERFPGWIIFLSNTLSILVYLSGLIIVINLHWCAGVIFLLAIMAFETRLLSRHCTKCYYWGKLCGFGKGRISSLFFKKEVPSTFCNNEMKWKDMIPDLLISMVPILLGIVLLLIKFRFIILAAIMLIILLSTAGNGYIRGKLTCKFCKQRELGCPAEKLFSKK